MPEILKGCVSNCVLHYTAVVSMNLLTIPAAFPVLITAALLSNPVSAGGRQQQMALPDFTKGDRIPEDATHDWNLGATGARGWIYSEKSGTDVARQIAVTRVAKGSPIANFFKRGDVILGVGGKMFSHDPRAEFGNALTVAESATGGLTLTRWREGRTEDVIVKIPVLGSYSATAPYDCPKSKRILELGCEVLAKRIGGPGYRQNPITRSLNALALLASGDPEYLPLVEKEAHWAAAYAAQEMQTWYYGYVIMLLSEYTMATGDNSVMPGLRRLALEAANGQSIVGSWGHKFAGPDGRLLGYGMMNAPGVPLTTSLVMARAAGVKDPEVGRAIERSAKLLRFYIGKGAIPYGDHDPWIQTHEDNGKCGMAAVLFNLLDEPKGAEFFSRMSLASHGAERDTGHTGNFWNILWSMPGVAQSGPQATGAWMQEFGAWYYDLARQWDGSFIHQGPPTMKQDHTSGWDATGGYLLAYAMPLKKIWLTGKRPGKIAQVDAAEAKQIILDGRGWSDKDRNSAYDKLSGDQLFECLGSWSPIVRERAAMALARRGKAPVTALLKLLDSPSLESRLGACQALTHLGGKAAPAVPLLRETLHGEDLWLRVKASDALAAIGQPAMSALPEMFGMLTKGGTDQDPRGMEQRFVSQSIFKTMLKNSIDGVDREQLRKAVAAGLRNQDGRARGTISEVYQKLSYEEIKPILPVIYETIVTPSPSGVMFADTCRIAGLAVLAKHRIKEGMPLCLAFLDLDRWNKSRRIAECLEILKSYGSAAKPLLPELRNLEKDLLVHRESKGLRKRIETTRFLIKKLENSTFDDAPELRSLN